MRNVRKAMPVLLTLVFAAGCDIHANTTNATEQVDEPALRPVMTGEQASGVPLRLWRKAYGNDGGSNSAWNAPAGSRVEVYEAFIIVTTPDGVAGVSQHGHYTGLAIKRD